MNFELFFHMWKKIGPDRFGFAIVCQFEKRFLTCWPTRNRIPGNGDTEPSEAAAYALISWRWNRM